VWKSKSESVLSFSFGKGGGSKGGVLDGQIHRAATIEHDDRVHGRVAALMKLVEHHPHIIVPPDGPAVPGNVLRLQQSAEYLHGAQRVAVHGHQKDDSALHKHDVAEDEAKRLRREKHGGGGRGQRRGNSHGEGGGRGMGEKI